MNPTRRAGALLLAALAASGCLDGPGAFYQPGTLEILLDVARIATDVQAYGDAAAGKARIAQGQSRLGLLDNLIANLTESQAKRDLKNAAEALRSALNGSAYLLDSFQALKVNRTDEARLNLEAAQANFTEAQALALGVSDPDLRAAMDFGGVAAEINRTATGLKGSK
jgi:hypothetical protein